MFTGAPVQEKANRLAAGRLWLDGRSFRDRHGRAVALRGVNLGGDCKVPASPDGRTFLPSDFADHRTVDFVGRPAPLDEIDGHLDRIVHWGFNCLRLLTTWEAVEHAGPRLYDQRYLDFYAEVCRRSAARGLHVVVDFHQDAWSRMSGGDGAPGWTFEAVGLDFTKFASADAAHVMQHRYDFSRGGRQGSYPLMSWSGNYRTPANAIMWTMFFGGHDFAPNLTVDGRTAPTFLQDHYLGAVQALAERVAGIDGVIGFDSLNEPGSGWIGRGLDEDATPLRGEAWSPLDGLAVAAGLSRSIPVQPLGGGTIERRLVNERQVALWLPGRTDPFRDAGVWDVASDGTARALRSDFFSLVRGSKVDVERDYMVPFFHRVATTIRSVREDWLLFAEVDPFGAMRGHGFPPGMPDRTVNASHWYDLTALVTKRFSPDKSVDILTGAVAEGRDAIEELYVGGLSRLKGIGDALNDGAPTLIGECGIQYDMNDASAYEAWAQGDHSEAPWSAQVAALDLMYNALDHLLLHSTQWNYTVTNRNDPMIGDGWNQEDLSIWSADQLTEPDDPDSGGRAVAGFCRPRVVAAQGDLLAQHFDLASRRFEARIAADPAIDAPTVIYLPDLHYRGDPDISVDGGKLLWRRGQLVGLEGSYDGVMTFTAHARSQR